MLFVVGGARLELHRLIALEGRYCHVAAEDRLGERNLLSAVEIVADAFKFFVLAHVDLDNEVAGLAIQRLVAAVFQPQQSAVVDGLGNLKIQFDFLLQDSVAFAGLTLPGAFVAAAIGAELDPVVGEAPTDAREGLESVNGHF